MSNSNNNTKSLNAVVNSPNRDLGRILNANMIPVTMGDLISSDSSDDSYQVNK